MLSKLSKDHVLSSIKGCETSTGSASGIQVTYGVWDSDGKLTNEVDLNAIGLVNGATCKKLNLEQGDLLKTITINYSNRRVTRL